MLRISVLLVSLSYLGTTLTGSKWYLKPGLLNLDSLIMAEINKIVEN